MNIKPLTHRSLAVLLTTILLLVAIPATAVLAATTTETVPTGNGFYTTWTGDYTLVDEGTASASCTSGDYILSATINQRESVSIPLTSIPNGSTITDVNVIARDRGDTTTGGTYRTFVRLNGTNSTDSASHSVTGTSGACTGSVNDAFDVTDTVKSGATTLEVGVVKGNATGVRVGVLSATITYTLTTTTTVTSNTNPSTYGGSVTFTATVSPSAATGTVEFYDGAALLGTGTLSSGTATLSTSALTAAASPHSITAKYLGNSPYPGSTSSAISQVVNKANATCNITGFSGVYNGSAHGASGSCTGGGILDLGATFTNVPGGTAHWTFTGDNNYNNQSGDVAVNISKANANCSSIAGYSVTYDGNSHTASGSCQGVGGDGILAGLDLSAASHTDAGSYLVDPWTFTDVTGNYSNASGTVASNIAKADAVISVAPYSIFYDGSEHSSTAIVTGAKGEDLSASLDLSATTHTVAGSYAGDAWSFTDVTGNYNDDSGTVDNNIDKADANCSTIAGYSATYDGSSHTAAGSCQGVGSDGTLVGLDLSATTHTDADSYVGDAWSFTDVTGNYNDANGTVDSDIAKADADCSSIAGYSVTYNGDPHTASGNCQGVGSDGTLAGLDLSATTHTDADSYVGDAWSFTDVTGNYNDANGTVDSDIAKADVVVKVTSYSVTYDGYTYTSTGTATGVNDEDLSDGLDLIATSHTDAGSYTGDAWTFTAPNANYNDASGTVDNEITKADVVIVVTPYNGTYDGSEHSATGTALGVDDEDLSAGLDLSATAHTAAGSYTGDAWTFTSSDANYNDASGTVDNNIAKADADCSTVAGYSVTHDGNSHTATGSCLGVGSEGALTGLDLSATSHTDIGTYEGDAWSFTDVTGNYNDASGAVNSVISAKLVPILSVSGGTFTYDGSPHAAAVTGSVAGTVSNVKYDGSATVPTNAGSYAVTADFLPADSITYETLASASAGTITINKAAPDCSSIAGYSVAHDGNSHAATGSCQGVGGDGTLAGLDLSATTHIAVGTYNDPWTFNDISGNYENASGTVNSSINDATPPAVNSVVRGSANPTSASSVDFTVTFSEIVTGVTADDFSLFTSGIAGASVSGVSGSGLVYTVSVNTGAGNGQLRLDVVNNGSIKDGANNPLAAPFNSGEMYQVLKGAATVGVFRPSNGIIYLKNSNTTGYSDIDMNYGIGGDKPVAGDWNGDGVDTIGVYRGNTFYLRNSNTPGYADTYFQFGSAGDQPIAGDWDGDGVDTIGVLHGNVFLLRNSNSAGPADMTFALGVPGDVGIAGDWDGDGVDTVGVFRPSNGVIYLKNSNTTGYADIAIHYGIGGDKPVTGDWDNDGVDTIGVLRGNVFYLRNSNTVGDADVWFALGLPGDLPIAGNWDGKP